jgi:plasmid stabilization system protein ParE
VTAALVVQPQAESDLDQAFRWYEARCKGLGDDFLDIVSHTFASIAEQPFRNAVVHREARRALLRRFPYAVLYVVRDERVFVLAVLHQRRDPRLIRERVRDFKTE